MDSGPLPSISSYNKYRAVAVSRNSSLEEMNCGRNISLEEMNCGRNISL